MTKTAHEREKTDRMKGKREDIVKCTPLLRREKARVAHVIKLNSDSIGTGELRGRFAARGKECHLTKRHRINLNPVSS